MAKGKGKAKAKEGLQSLRDRVVGQRMEILRDDGVADVAMTGKTGWKNVDRMTRAELLEELQEEEG